MDVRLGIVREFREKVSKLDAELLWTLERRLKLVNELQAWKKESGIPPVDRGRESYIVTLMQRQYEDGKGEYLTPESIETFFLFVLSLTKDELHIVYDGPHLDDTSEIPF